MARQQSKGKCGFCGGTFSKGAMRRHLDSCKERKVPKGTGHIFHIVVDAGEYWMHLDAGGDATLKDLDGFLRGIWLECCGHLSAFTIQGIQYMSDPYYDEDTGMDVILDRVIAPGMKFIHEYDFGTTTELDLKVVSEREGAIEGGIQLLARNDPPEIICGKCGEPATTMCTGCFWESKGWLCDKCAGEHECGEEMMMPVVNSPRVGVCGYTG
ncbi:MAG: hypothetical protein A7316_04550 [Candidatus Altiarchaeales archaeon WOR_SM1_86-2]|nr:MAG: hypothetical protein A7316_04550 [Candidatus Altiarchaeales archaeon WOR_SM1_86-2]ODS37856.1 MAG: hypothetical protein A7315_03605 [Candidatus Altiarchaeales archaeon WOR_SM1_79]